MYKLAITISVCLATVTANAQEFSLVGRPQPQILQAQPQVRQYANQPPPQPVAFALGIPAKGMANNDDPPVTPPEIIGGGNYNIGDLVELSVAPSEPPQNLHSVIYSWTVIPDTPMREWPDSSKIYFGTGKVARTLIVILTASYVFVDKDENNIILNVNQGALTVRTTVKIGDGNDDGGNDGDDDGNNDGDEPTFSSPLAKSAYEWAGLVAGNDYSIAKTKHDANALADAFLSVKAQIESTDPNNPFQGSEGVSKIFEQSKIVNDQALGENKVYWQPWFDQMSNYLRKAFNDGVITTPPQYAVAWGQIAEGLKAAAK